MFVLYVTLRRYVDIATISAQTLSITFNHITMKRFLPLLAVLAFLSLNLGCSKKCYECTLFGITNELCEEDGVSASQLEDDVEALEFLGYTCTEK